LAEQSGIGATLAHSNAREARANAIMRQPQIVGYSPKAHRSGEATMGWLIGPRYKISSDPKGLVSFRHVPIHHILTNHCTFNNTDLIVDVVSNAN
jgi:hypothetical protein